MRAFAEKVEIELRKVGGQAVGIFKLDYMIFRVPGAKAILKNLRLARDDGLEEAVWMNVLRRQSFRATQHPNLLCSRQVGADGERRRRFYFHEVRTENVEGVRMFSVQNRFEFRQRRGCRSQQVSLFQHIQTIVYENRGDCRRQESGDRGKVHPGMRGPPSVATARSTFFTPLSELPKSRHDFAGSFCFLTFFLTGGAHRRRRCGRPHCGHRRHRRGARRRRYGRHHYVRRDCRRRVLSRDCRLRKSAER